ncbi:hypothetical protein J6590_027289 [Homalodisca vitripennis]|nr:hypothetical protein J6590_027289 [Homalodisca vitripennis]
MSLDVNDVEISGSTQPNCKQKISSNRSSSWRRLTRASVECPRFVEERRERDNYRSITSKGAKTGKSEIVLELVTPDHQPRFPFLSRPKVKMEGK